MLASPWASDVPFTDFARCLYGFAAGVLVFGVYSRMSEWLINVWTGAAIEIAAISVCAVFIAASGGAHWLAPIAFAPAVLVFALEAGPISALLRRQPFAMFGTLSYSIYMVHAVLILMMTPLIPWFERTMGLHLTTRVDDSAPLWGTTTQEGDLAIVLMLVLVTAVSALTYISIEKPGRDWGVAASKRWRERGWLGVFARSALSTRN